MNPVDSLRFFFPELFLLAGAFLVLIFDLFIGNKKSLALIALLTLAGAALLTRVPSLSYNLFYGFFTLDPFTHYFRFIALGASAITVLISMSYKQMPKHYEGEFYALILFLTFGLILMGGSANLLAIFLSIEFVSLLSYLLVGFLKHDVRSKEASLKYLLVGSVASGIMLYGMSLLFGISGSLDLATIQQVIAGKKEFTRITLFAFIFISTGLGFKISMVPFHAWAPDVYQAAPTPVTAFLTVAPKALGFAVFIRVLSSAFVWLGVMWSPVIVLLSILTMTLGNVIAVAQTNVKRLLAYSSIAQAGYILMGLAVFNETGLSGILIYLAAYAFTNLGAFTAVIVATNASNGNEELSAFTGLSKRAPFTAACLTVFLLSLAGLPPLAGFIGKFFVFSGTIQAKYYVLAIAAAINSAVAAFYYFKIVRQMYLTSSEDEATPVAQPFGLRLALTLMLIGVVVTGILPSPLIQFVKGMLLV